jgi:hypothetical protein
LVSCSPEKGKIQNQVGEHELARTIEQDNVLSECLKQKDVFGIYDLIDSGLNPNILVKGDPIICWATINEYDDLVEKLVNMGADVNFKTSEGIPFFHLAIYKLKDSTIFFIWNNGLNISSLDGVESKDIFYSSIFNKNIKLQKCLINNDEFIKKIISYSDLLCYLSSSRLPSLELYLVKLKLFP